MTETGHEMKVKVNKSKLNSDDFSRIILNHPSKKPLPGRMANSLYNSGDPFAKTMTLNRDTKSQATDLKAEVKGKFHEIPRQ